MTRFVGISGKKGVGKDSLCSVLRLTLENLGYKTARTALADRVRDMAYNLFGRYGVKPSAFYMNDRVERETPLKSLGGLTPRDAWKVIGNSMREIHPDVWVDQVLKDSWYQQLDYVFIPDVRFLNEVERIHALGGRVIRVLRPDLPAPAPDPFDDALDEYDKWDGKFVNMGPLNSNPDLVEVVRAIG